MQINSKSKKLAELSGHQEDGSKAKMKKTKKVNFQTPDMQDNVAEFSPTIRPPSLKKEAAHQKLKLQKRSNEGKFIFS